MSKIQIENLPDAWTEVKKLYPDVVSRIKYCTWYKGYYVFSIGYNDPKTNDMFLDILYIKQGESKIWFFSPHT